MSESVWKCFIGTNTIRDKLLLLFILFYKIIITDIWNRYPGCPFKNVINHFNILRVSRHKRKIIFYDPTGIVHLKLYYLFVIIGLKTSLISVLIGKKILIRRNVFIKIVKRNKDCDLII